MEVNHIDGSKSNFEVEADNEQEAIKKALTQVDYINPVIINGVKALETRQINWNDTIEDYTYDCMIEGHVLHQNNPTCWVCDKNTTICSECYKPMNNVNLLCDDCNLRGLEENDKQRDRMLQGLDY